MIYLHQPFTAYLFIYWPTIYDLFTHHLSPPFTTYISSFIYDLQFIYVSFIYLNSSFNDLFLSPPFTTYIFNIYLRFIYVSFITAIYHIYIII